MRAKTLLMLFALFGILSANRAFAEGMGEWTGLNLRVTEIRYENGELRETLPNTKVTAVFLEKGSITGSAGCNNYSVAFRVDGSNIQIGSAATTRMFCNSPKGIMEQEAAYLRALKSAKQFSGSDGRLELLDSKGKIVVALVDADSEKPGQRLAELYSGLWHVESMGGKRLLKGTKITMNFTEDGRVAGKATVNNYFASWIESDGLILFSHAGSTMMAGAKAEMKQESEFFRMLNRVRKYKIHKDQLTLTTVEGEKIIAVRDVAEIRGTP